jgi:hypothetical protein
MGDFLLPMPRATRRFLFWLSLSSLPVALPGPFPHSLRNEVEVHNFPQSSCDQATQSERLTSPLRVARNQAAVSHK